MAKRYRMKQPDRIRRDYSRTLQKIGISIIRVLAGRLKNNNAISAMDLKNAYQQWSTEWPDKKLAGLIEPFAYRVDAFSYEETKKFLGIRLREPTITLKVPQWIENNVGLIRKNIEVGILDRLQSDLASTLSDGVRWEVISERLQQAGNISQRHARLIARDQVGKLYGNVNQARQEASGISEYIWRTMSDNRVRDEHEKYEGQHFKWAQPPPDGHPGEAILCRCYPEPILL